MIGTNETSDDSPGRHVMSFLIRSIFTITTGLLFCRGPSIAKRHAGIFFGNILSSDIMSSLSSNKNE